METVSCSSPHSQGAVTNKATVPAAALQQAIQERTGGHPVTLNPQLAKILGINAALVLNQFLYWQSVFGDWFWMTEEQLYDELGMKRKKFLLARKVLRDTGILSEELRGWPPKLHFDVNLVKLNEIVDEAKPLQFAQKVRSDDASHSAQKVRNDAHERFATIRTKGAEYKEREISSKTSSKTSYTAAFRRRAARVCRALSMTGTKNEAAILEVLNLEVQNSGQTPDEVAARMVASWKAYRAIEEPGFRYDLPLAFFQSGTWLREDGWRPRPSKRDLRESQLRAEARVGSPESFTGTVPPTEMESIEYMEAEDAQLDRMLEALPEAERESLRARAEQQLPPQAKVWTPQVRETTLRHAMRMLLREQVNTGDRVPRKKPQASVISFGERAVEPEHRGIVQ